MAKKPTRILTPTTNKPKKRQAPGRSVESRENQLISLAVSTAEKQLRDGTASAQVITHFLKLGTTNASLEREKLIKENLLLEAKTDALKSAKKVEELYTQALKAMRLYSGRTLEDTEDDND